MSLAKYVISTLILFMLYGCAGAHISIPVGPVTIGTDISMFSGISHDRDDGHSDEEAADESISDEYAHQHERE